MADAVLRRDAKHRCRSLATRDNSNNGDSAKGGRAAFKTDERTGASAQDGAGFAFRNGGQRRVHETMMPKF